MQLVCDGGGSGEEVREHVGSVGFEGTCDPGEYGREPSDFLRKRARVRTQNGFPNGP